MKRILLFLISSLCLQSTLAVAEGGFYLGFDLHDVNTEIATDSSDDFALGLVMGYDFGNKFAIEGQTFRSAFDFFSGIDIRVTGIHGVYNAYVTDEFYSKIKLGYATIDYESTGGFLDGLFGSTLDDHFNHSDSHFSIGFGLGWRPGEHHYVELEYLKPHEDSYSVSLGYRYKF